VWRAAVTPIIKHNIPIKVREIIDASWNRTVVMTPAAEPLRAFVGSNFHEALQLLMEDWHKRQKAGGLN
jgi:hypothetical protein